MPREALSYIQRNFLIKTIIKHPDRTEAARVWNFSCAAIEEAVVNAVYHRSYEERESIEVRISHDKLVVVSFSGLDRSIRMEDLKAGSAVSRCYRNRRIGEILKELEMTERRSTGIPKILKEIAANGSPTPLFETDDDRLSFVIRLRRATRWRLCHQREQAKSLGKSRRKSSACCVCWLTKCHGSRFRMPCSSNTATTSRRPA